MRSWPAINRFKHPLFIRSFYSFLFSVRSKAFSFPRYATRLDSSLDVHMAQNNGDVGPLQSWLQRWESLFTITS